MAMEVKYCCSRISQKWVFAVMGFFCIFSAFAMRMCLPLTIPKMVKQHSVSLEFLDDSCPAPPNFNSHNRTSNNATVVGAGTYDWSEYTQGIILGSFYWGYVTSHVPGGILAERFGGKHVLGLGILATSIFTILSPFAVYWGGATALIWLRVVMGLCEGTTQPAISVMLAQWIPAEERSKTSTFVFMGAMFGVLFVSLGLGPILETMDWPGVYYLFGGFGVVWYLLWIVLCYNNPREHPFISEAEAKQLNEKLSEHTHADAPPVPWKHLLTSMPFWALVVATVGRDFGGYTMLADMPKYTMSVLKFTVYENGLLVLLMNVTMFASCFVFSWMSDWLILKGYMSRTNVRKLMGTIGIGVHGMFVVLAGYVGCDQTMYFVVTFLTSLVAGPGFPGVKANVLDLSPNYAGTVMAISHGLAGLCGIGGPYLVGILAPNQTLSEWRLVFWIICGVSLVANVVFFIFGSGDVQDWNDPNFDRKKKKKVEEVAEVEKLLTLDKVQIVSGENIVVG